MKSENQIGRHLPFPLTFHCSLGKTVTNEHIWRIDSNQSIISLFKVIVIGNPSYFKVITNEQTCERVSRREAGPKENIKNISHFFLFSFYLLIFIFCVVSHIL